MNQYGQTLFPKASLVLPFASFLSSYLLFYLWSWNTNMHLLHTCAVQKSLPECWILSQVLSMFFFHFRGSYFLETKNLHFEIFALL